MEEISHRGSDTRVRGRPKTTWPKGGGEREIEQGGLAYAHSCAERVSNLTCNQLLSPRLLYFVENHELGLSISFELAPELTPNMFTLTNDSVVRIFPQAVAILNS